MKPCCNFCKHAKKEFYTGVIECSFFLNTGSSVQSRYHDWMKAPCAYFKKDPLKNIYGVTEENYIRDFLFARMCVNSLNYMTDLYRQDPLYRSYNSYLIQHKRETMTHNSRGFFGVENRNNGKDTDKRPGKQQ